MSGMLPDEKMTPTRGSLAPESRRELRLFIASPSDCGEERRTVRMLAEELNKVFCRFFGLLLVPVGWEEIAPGLGRPQDVIDDQIGEYDILVGVMWLRFGTPTGDGDQSGTEHEFKTAYSLWKETGRPRVMFYFCDLPPESISQLDTDQFSKVQRFRQKLERIGLVRMYRERHEFEQLLRLDLQRVIRDLAARTMSDQALFRLGRRHTRPGRLRRERRRRYRDFPAGQRLLGGAGDHEDVLRSGGRLAGDEVKAGDR